MFRDQAGKRAQRSKQLSGVRQLSDQIQPLSQLQSTQQGFLLGIQEL